MVGADLLIPRLTQQIIDQGIAAGDLGVIAGMALAMIGAAIILGYMFSVSRIHLVSLHPFLPLPLGEGIG
ncbi:TPA: hypothetical protein DCY65_04465 [Candidatus Acetothermia bacterium]|nr:hypothetical protein [Candidatus Acetothermia bacterium]